MNKQYFTSLNGYFVKDKRINNIVDNKLDVNFLSIGNTPVSQSDTRHLGDCIVIKGDKNIIIDLGFQTNCEHLIDFLNNNDIDRIDYVIITHYHLDHIGGSNASGLNALLNTNTIDFSNCIFYLPHKDINWSNFTGTTFESLETTIKNLLTSKSIEYIEPNNEDVLSINENLKLTFLNIGSSFYNDYYNDFIDWNLNVLTNTIYNNFSMVVILEHFNNKFLFSADIYRTAQEKLYRYFKNIDVLKVEHHGLNVDTSEHYLEQLNPKYAVIGDLDVLTGTELARNTVNSLYEKGCKIFRTTNGGDITITSTYDDITANDIEAMDLYGVNYSLYEGIPIPDSADLNDYLTPGIYNSYRTQRTATLTHCPFNDAGFKMIVERHTYSKNSIRQTILRNNNDGCIYVRCIIGNVVGNWNKITPSKNFYLTSSDFTVNETFEITFTDSNNETRFECKNDVCILSLSLNNAVDIPTGTTFITLPTTINIHGEERTINYGNKITNFNLVDGNGNIYPVYLGGGNQLRSRKTIPASAPTIRGTVSFVL